MSEDLLFPFGEPPTPGKSVQVAPGVLWLRMPMPFALTHINLWALRDVDGGWAIVDSGLQTVETAAAWRELLSADGPLQGAPLTRVLATHMHPDHIGMAGWLTRRFDVSLWMTRLEYTTCRVLAADTGREAPADGVRFYRAAGWNDDDLDNYRARFGSFGKMIHRLPDSFHRLADGQVNRIGEHDWEVVIGLGHSPEHACLYCRSLSLLISGDQVLPRISSNVSVHPTEPAADPLADWLATLDKIRRRVPDDVLVLPAHNEPFRGLHARLDQLEQSVLRSLDRLREQLREPKRVVDVFGALFLRPVTHEPHLLSLATGESIAHVNYLLGRGEATLDRMEDGAAWYRLDGRTAT
jgi:glyoxylase-like metal-dependent hydrolase (beta-lactamase superfamily II)